MTSVIILSVVGYLLFGCWSASLFIATSSEEWVKIHARGLAVFIVFLWPAALIIAPVIMVCLAIRNAREETRNLDR